jgi:3'-phosphoadenosine 5'-phosphosulfate sulfotransferase (PAPS reductase)/FAD synthetase
MTTTRVSPRACRPDAAGKMQPGPSFPAAPAAPVAPKGFDTYILAYSGGRDSTAALYWCLEHIPAGRLRIAHHPTGADWPQLAPYIDSVAHHTGATIETVALGDLPLPPGSTEREAFAGARTLFDLVAIRGRWPSYWQRYCTTYLKAWPLRLYAANLPRPVLIFGERAEESEARARRPHLGPDTFKGPNRYCFPIFRPILSWTSAHVDAYLQAHGAPANPIYTHAPRCSCWLCPLLAANRRQMLTFMRLYPHLARPWVELEAQIGHTWRHNRPLANIWDLAHQHDPDGRPLGQPGATRAPVTVPNSEPAQDPRAGSPAPLPLPQGPRLGGLRPAPPAPLRSASGGPGGSALVPARSPSRWTTPSHPHREEEEVA